MNVLKNKMQRRDFLRSIAKAGLTTAFASQFMLSSNVFAQTGGAKRFVMVFYPNGCTRDLWHSYNSGTLGSGSFGVGPLHHLDAHINKVVAFKNLTFKGHGGNEGHPEACRGVFSGGQEYGPTFDAAIGEALGGRLTNNMHVGLWSSRTKGADYMPFRDKNSNKVVVPDNPQQVYDNLLADIVRNSNTNSSDPETERRQKVLEALHENLDLLQSNVLNVKQNGKLLTHEESLNYYQNVLGDSLNIGGSDFARPTIGMTGVDDDGELIAKAQMRNIAMAFQADITRTASFQFMGAQDESLKINFPSIRPFMTQGDYHIPPKLYHNEVYSHVSSHNVSPLFSSQTHWYNIMVAYLMDELASRPDLAYGGSLLDNTLILVMSEMGAGDHQQENPGIYVAGGAGGAIQSGKAIDTMNTGMSNLYLDIAKAFGLNWNRYGNSYGGISGFLR